MTSPLLLPRRVPVAEIPGMVDALRESGILTPDEAARIGAIERASFCLVRIDGMGERWRCNGCNGRHEFFTHGCIPIPYRGLRDGLRAYWQNTAVPDADLSPEQLRRRERVADALGFADALPALGEHHPETARALATRSGSTDVGVWVLGTIEPISRAKAAQYAAQINAKARRVIVRI